MSALFNIPLVFYGENEAEYGNPIADANKAKRDVSYFSEQSFDDIYLGGVSVKELVEDFGVRRSELQPYLPLQPEEVNRVNMEVHYLGYYLKWHPQSCYYYAVEHGGFDASVFPGDSLNGRCRYAGDGFGPFRGLGLSVECAEYVVRIAFLIFQSIRHL